MGDVDATTVWPGWDHFIERMKDMWTAALFASAQQRRFRHLYQQLPVRRGLLAREQNRRDAAALAHRAQAEAEPPGARFTAWDLLALARSVGDPVQGIRFGQPWTALVPPHARHLIDTTGGPR